MYIKRCKCHKYIVCYTYDSTGKKNSIEYLTSVSIYKRQNNLYVFESFNKKRKFFLNRRRVREFLRLDTKYHVYRNVTCEVIIQVAIMVGFISWFVLKYCT